MANHQKVNDVHLQNIQSNINRLATISFAIKGWSVTLVSAMFALSAQNANSNFVLVAYFPAIMFWLLDSYFLGMERRFVEMYNQTVKGLVPVHEIMPHNFKSKRACMSSAAFSRTLLLFHGSLIVTIIVVMMALSEL
ncbi:hypothetical protein P3631_19135 [Vibrio parahaemolyticus]|uniref:hypothetical protein n=1 Tax=Vibrio TaxID=662 RepID=UPI00146B878B|nr:MULTISPECIES: hypothetical protein [Vibrio]EKB1969617.1 hypothetical protein [Vibrio parahaemolyticus]MDF5089494.1 hypothetical protein [Vibrio parahaemolyticus]MDF5138052.1 hypothetical protein [Vibrio parahaemolyticus]MDW2263970.1 hypothetical protein [Vibrio sp. 1557]NMU20356.1 hypothetical protein [Vibrio parahaemolyticus]